MASSCARGGLDWILGKAFSPKGLLSIGTGCPGKWLSHHPWGCLKDVLMWCLGTWCSGGLGSVRLMVGLDDLKGLFQPKRFYDINNNNFSARDGSKSVDMWRRDVQFLVLECSMHGASDGEAECTLRRVVDHIKLAGEREFNTPNGRNSIQLDLEKSELWINAMQQYRLGNNWLNRMSVAKQWDIMVPAKLKMSHNVVLQSVLRFLKWKGRRLKNGERMQQRTTKVIGAIGPISYEEGLRESGWFSLAKKRG
ncbi:hypothetical protein QYF61_011408 [Mycteria americana]|uniref:Uncharacterized protein n=1 Tax=Mycteria americana TaxID=33587 RepID=A0AAN7S6P6_MYCAM|nr:hypothetical protein QYF61_011408 [Mycteria americana]